MRSLAGFLMDVVVLIVAASFALTAYADRSWFYLGVVIVAALVYVRWRHMRKLDFARVRGRVRWNVNGATFVGKTARRPGEVYEVRVYPEVRTEFGYLNITEPFVVWTPEVEDGLTLNHVVTVPFLGDEIETSDWFNLREALKQGERYLRWKTVGEHRGRVKNFLRWALFVNKTEVSLFERALREQYDGGTVDTLETYIETQLLSREPGAEKKSPGVTNALPD
jgi:hypothetical protein